MLPIPELKVLLYGPDIPPNGIKARAHFADSMLVVHGKEHHFTIQCDRLNLETGGFDGKQWMLTWLSASGQVTAMLQGDEAVKALVKLAPPAFSSAIALSLKRRGGGRRPSAILIALAVAMVFFLLFWWFSEYFFGMACKTNPDDV